MKKRSFPILLVFLILLITAAGCGNNNAPAQSPGTALTVTEETGTLKVFFIDAGKGDAALIGIPGGYWAMIDSGPEEGFAETGRKILNSGAARLSAVFLTHGHNDHAGGLGGVLSMAECEAIYTNGDAMNESGIVNAASGVPIKRLSAGDRIDIGEASFSVLGPIGSYSDENDNSLVIMLKYKDTKILFAADQTFTAERDLLSLGSELDADVLKAAHHGEGDTSSSEVIEAVSPKYAIITTDVENPPSQQVLGNISRAGGLAFVLGSTGTMLLESDGRDLKLSPLTGPEGLPPDIRVEAKDTSAEYVTVVNRTDKAADLTGWCISSEKGNEVFFFPAGTQLSPGNKLKVLSGDAAKTEQGMVWSSDKIWSKKDTCVLYDNYGREVSRL